MHLIFTPYQHTTKEWNKFILISDKVKDTFQIIRQIIFKEITLANRLIFFHKPLIDTGQDVEEHLADNDLTAH